MKCWCYCGLPNELNDSNECKENNNTTNCYKIDCDVNNKEAKHLDYRKLKMKSRLIKLLILVKLNNIVQKMTTLTHWSKVPKKLIVLGLGKPYGIYCQKYL